MVSEPAAMLREPKPVGDFVLLQQAGEALDLALVRRGEQDDAGLLADERG